MKKLDHHLTLRREDLHIWMMLLAACQLWARLSRLIVSHIARNLCNSTAVHSFDVNVSCGPCDQLSQQRTSSRPTTACLRKSLRLSPILGPL